MLHPHYHLERRGRGQPPVLHVRRGGELHPVHVERVRAHHIAGGGIHFVFRQPKRRQGVIQFGGPSGRLGAGFGRGFGGRGQAASRIMERLGLN